MNTEVGDPRIGQWYRHLDKGEIFQVTGVDEASRTIEVQTYGGDLDEIDKEVWYGMPLELAEQPEDWTGPVDDVETDDLGYSDTGSAAGESTAPLESVAAAAEAEWEDTTDLDELEPRGEGLPAEQISQEQPAGGDRLA